VFSAWVRGAQKKRVVNNMSSLGQVRAIKHVNAWLEWTWLAAIWGKIKGDPNVAREVNQRSIPTIMLKDCQGVEIVDSSVITYSGADPSAPILKYCVGLSNEDRVVRIESRE